ncbi:ABC transporter substrate-binding protein [Bosea vaviloviae]|uniref:ABC transporter substrate-binding protein n=1 Tax=Bosea vaviloviae TaxID=1526658 RepID=A0A1D7UC23_9HYPH|nr:ABC transporter substrate-binding protein [Bosea vaviloviae]AOO84917.1 ABC transporter substrate-binding protein [Bosea vaviloviae]
MRALVLAGLLSVAAAPAPAQDTVTIGAVLSVTGAAAFLGEPEEKTLRIYVDKLNAEGGLLGKQIKLVIYDDGSDANKARTFATRLLDDGKIAAMIGGTTTGASMAMLPVFEERGVPFISLASGISIIEPVRKFVFKVPHTDRMACERIFEDMKARGLSKVGLISGSDGLGQSMRDQCVAVAPRFGVQIVADEKYGARDSDMTAQLAKIKAVAGLQAVLNAGAGQSPAIVTRNFAQLGFSNVALYQSHGVASKSFIELTGAASEGVRLPSAALLIAGQLPASDIQKPVVMAYKQTYEAATGQPVSTFGGHAYDALMIVADAAKRAKSLDPEKLRDAIETTKEFVGTGGVFSFDSQDHLGLGPSAFKMIVIKNGDWTLAN